MRPHRAQFNRCQQTLHAATYGDLHGVVSVVIDRKRRVQTRSEFAKLLRRTGQRAGASIDPCADAVQLRTIFGAFLFPDGRLRRGKVQRTRLLRGNLTDAAAAILDEAVRAGFIVQVAGRNAYECAKGQPFQAMVAFARNLELSPEVAAILNGLCPSRIAA